MSRAVVVPHTPPDAKLRFTVRENGLLKLVDVSTHPNPVDSDAAGWTFRWDFGNGASATGRKVQHRYATIGPVEVTLRVTDNDNATGVLRRTIDLSDTSPVPDFAIDGPAMSTWIHGTSPTNSRRKRAAVIEPPQRSATCFMSAQSLFRPSRRSSTSGICHMAVSYTHLTLPTN